MRTDADIAILGGGCAGLSLAVALGEMAPHLSVEILEARTEYVRDRTWCFWNTQNHPFEQCVSHEWSRWRVRAGGETVLQESDRYRYQHIPGDRFYQFAQERISAAKQQRLTLGASVLAVESNGDSVDIDTGQGVLRARWVFDSRPATRTQTSGLIQSFLGWHIVTEQDCFDVTTVDLMNFQTSTKDDHTTFFYVLPFAANEALVEVTYLDLPGLPRHDAEADLAQRIRGEYEVLYREQGCLPMRMENSAKTQDQDRVCRIGTLGGRVKPSSGYAFLRIQRQSRALALALANDSAIPRRYEPRFYGLLDSVFLKVLEKRPAQAADYFVPLFQKTSADSLVRFLSENAGPWESLCVGMALPKVRSALAACEQDFLTARLALFAAAVLAVCFAPAPGKVVLPALLIGIAIAIWHGAFDGVLAQPLMEKRFGHRWFPMFASGYVALAVFVALMWWIAPQILLPAFLLYSAWHFGTEADSASTPLGTLAVGFAMGVTPIAAACRWHGSEVNLIFTRMAGATATADMVTTWTAAFLWPAVLIVTVGTLLGFKDKKWLALIGLELLLFWRCEPLLAFGMFFCLWHTPEHLFTTSQDATGHFSKRVLSQHLRSGIVPWLMAVAVFGLMAARGHKNVMAYASELFILLSALTFPHMALNEIRRRG